MSELVCLKWSTGGGKCLAVHNSLDCIAHELYSMCIYGLQLVCFSDVESKVRAVEYAGGDIWKYQPFFSQLFGFTRRNFGCLPLGRRVTAVQCHSFCALGWTDSSHLNVRILMVHSNVGDGRESEGGNVTKRSLVFFV